MEQRHAVGRQTQSLPLTTAAGSVAPDRLVMTVAPYSACVITLNRQ